MFFLLHGDDTHSKTAFLEKQIAKLGDPQMVDLNTTRLEGNGLTVSDLKAACNAMPFLAPKRIVLVDNFLSSKPSKEAVKQLKEFVPNVPETTNLILLESNTFRETNAFVKLGADKKVAYVRHFRKPEGAALDKWIKTAVEERGGHIQNRAVYELATNVGNNLQALENEIEKLTLYRGDEPILAEDVHKLGVHSAESNIFDLVDALGNRNGKRAVTLLQAKINEGGDPFYIFSMFIRQFRLLIQVKSCIDNGMKKDEIAKSVGIHPFVAGKMTQQSGSFSMKQLQKIYAHLLSIDVGVKSGETDMATELDLLVASLSR